jgi:hypothetical protein
MRPFFSDSQYNSWQGHFQMKTDPEELVSISLFGRFIKVLPFLIILIVLGLWSAGIYLLQETQTVHLTDDLRCLTFFGGLVIAITFGGLAGSFLRRFILKRLMRRKEGREK